MNYAEEQLKYARSQQKESYNEMNSGYPQQYMNSSGLPHSTTSSPMPLNIDTVAQVWIEILI